MVHIFVIGFCGLPCIKSSIKIFTKITSFCAMLNLPMASIIDLSIPPGLETLFQQLLGFFTSPSTVVLRKNNSSVPRSRRVHLTNKTYLIYFASVYDPLSSARHTAWTAYWGGLTFSNHAGANQYPGSGFSAFLFVNAPRYKAGLDLLLDPPGGGLLTNGDFFTDLSGWGVDSAFAFIWDNHHALQYLPEGFLTQDVVLVPGLTYRLAFSYRSMYAGGLVDFNAGLGIATSNNIVHVTGSHPNLTQFSHDFLCDVGDLDGPTVTVGFQTFDYSMYISN
ncbi:MAG: hypothetical protein ACHQVK_03775, partial [Candidatus Paceibacterales bacterium]